MDVRDIQGGGAQRLDPLQRDALSGAREVGKRAEATPSEKAPAEDRVDLSEAARTAAQQAEETPELEFARQALRSVPSISPERVAAILRHLQSGYYQQPAIIKEIAERIVEEMLAESLPQQ
ncbi:flagellar biosynthesis anti-sigma factor FlgM [Rhodothermus profundi]|uniref:Anti-sigma-28 factor, FlgM n=1 Tax=Rhodothermus profundi TaxID=633813 RepID=A0A1M6X7M9_9BACT|nr:flagellar biosynthesis anti-sigma factor FlgM [Rhodothermus profundi]SHL01961.1 Anti-sigma-28 factor, FlgM [Rhodothermus profundi]